MSERQAPTRRDLREAKGYLTDLLNSAPLDSAHTADSVADFLLDHAHRINVQRSGDLLVLYFDLDEEASATTPALTVVS